MKAKPRIFLALPILNEWENLPALFDCLKKQTEHNFCMVACVNNYDSWWNEPSKIEQCDNNSNSLTYLKNDNTFSIRTIDRSSKGLGWPEKKGGVGWARKVAMDLIASEADPIDIIVSIDADTHYPEDYLSAIIKYFKSKPESYGLSLPYYHKLSDKNTDRLILRYEIYMRYYLLNMLRIRNPYAYTALGSAMAFPVWAYKKVGGLTPVKSGEDFYFLQKLVKNGNIGIWAETLAYPSSRFSDRVLFGTGPALIKGNTGDWNSYPIYANENYNLIEQTFEQFPELFKKNLPTPMDNFLREQNKNHDLWGALRENYKDPVNFVKACIRKVDGLRILQFLRNEQANLQESEEYYLINYLLDNQHFKSETEIEAVVEDFSFEKSEIMKLSSLRDLLFKFEMKMRKDQHEKL